MRIIPVIIKGCSFMVVDNAFVRAVGILTFSFDFL